MIPAYKGKNDEQESFKILILGESTYTEAGKWVDDLPSDRNRAIIEDYVFKHDPGRTMERAVGVFYGRRATYEEQCEFWGKTSFANFIQSSIWATHRDDPAIRIGRADRSRFSNTWTTASRNSSWSWGKACGILFLPQRRKTRRLFARTRVVPTVSTATKVAMRSYLASIIRRGLDGAMASGIPG